MNPRCLPKLWLWMGLARAKMEEGRVKRDSQAEGVPREFGGSLGAKGVIKVKVFQRHL